MLTGSGVALILRVVGTPPNEPWNTDGWYIFAGVAAFSLLTKYVIKYRGSHVFNPSNIGLVVAFLVLGTYDDRALRPSARGVPSYRAWTSVLPFHP